MFLSLVSHQLLLILKAGFTRDRQQWKCDEITAAVLRFKAQGLYRLGTKIKYSEGVNPGHLLLSEQKLVHRCILCITREGTGSLGSPNPSGSELLARE